MGLLTQTKEEYEYYVDSLREGMLLIGQDATLYEVDQENKDMYWDVDATHTDGREISLIFEDNPKPTMDHFNWAHEKDEEYYVAHIVSKDNDGDPLKISEWMIIKLHSHYGLISNRLFQVTNVRGSSIDPLTWICKLVPYRFKADIDPETPGPQEVLDHKEHDTDFSYLKVSGENSRTGYLRTDLL